MDYSKALKLVKNNPSNIKIIPKEYHTEEIGLIVVDADPNLLQHVMNYSHVITLHAFKLDPLSIRHRIDPNHPEYLDAIKTILIKQNYKNLKLLGSLQTEDDAFLAVTINGFALLDVVDKKEYIQLEAVKTTPEAIVLIDNVNVQFNAIILNKDLINIIHSNKMFTDELAIMLMDFDINFFHYIPYINQRIANKAYELNNEFYFHIPEEYRTEKMKKP